MKYFVLKSHSFEDRGVKFKSGQVVDLTEGDVAVFNGIVPGMFEEYVPARHTPAPSDGQPAEEAAPPAEGFVTEPVYPPKVEGEKPEEPAGMTTQTMHPADAE